MKVVPESRSLVSWSLALAAVLAMLSAQADTWRLNAGTPSSGAAFSTDASYWTSDTTHEKGSGNLNPNDDYIVSGYQLRAKNTFGGGSLAIGDLANPNYASRICMDSTLTINVPLTLNTGYIYINTYSSSYETRMGTYTITAPKTEVTAPADKPFGFYANYAWRTIKLTSLSGAEGTGIVVGGNYTSKGELEYDSIAKSNFVFYAVDASAYKGDIKVISNGTLAPSGWDAALKLGTAEIGTLDVSAGSEFQGESGASELTVSSLTLHAGSRLRAAWDGTAYTASVIRVTSAFEIPEEEGVVEVVFSSKPTQREAPTILPLLVVPDTQDLDLARFVARDIGDADAQPRLSVVPDEESHTKTLVATICGRAQLITADSTEWTKSAAVLATYTSALEHGEQWSDGLTPHANMVYWFGQDTGYANSLRTPYTPDAYDPEKAYVFPGRVLRATGTQAILTFANHQAFEVNLESDGASLVMRVANGRDPILRGTIRTDARMTVYAYGTSVFTIESDISGSGDLGVHGYTGTGSPSATTWLKGDNSDWKGVLDIKSPVYNGTPPNESKHLTIGFGSAESFGGRLDEMDYKALKLIDFSALTVENDLALAEDLNRGIYVQSNAIVSVSADCTFVCPCPVTLNGTLLKKGTGTIALGGGMKFCDETGAVVDAVPGDDANRTIDFRSGTLKALAHNCVDGALIKSASAATFAIPFNPEDATLKKYGFYNVKTDTPFVLDKPINIKLADVDTAALEAARLTDDGYKQGIITVKTIAAKNVEDNLVVEKVKGLRLIREDDAETGFTTFSLYGKKAGILLLVR